MQLESVRFLLPNLFLLVLGLLARLLFLELELEIELEIVLERPNSLDDMLEVKFVLSFVEELLFLVKLVLVEVLFEVLLVSLVGSCALRYVSAGVDAVDTVFFKLVILLRDLNMEGIFVVCYCE